MVLEELQEAIRQEGLDGWLFFDHHQRDPIAYRVLRLSPGKVTRRWYYFVPATGEPRALLHRIEPKLLNGLPGGKRWYSTWDEQRQELAALLEGSQQVAMQYSPLCNVPYVSNVDAGTVELVRSLGVEVKSSAGLVQLFEARWSAAQLASHLRAGQAIDEIRRQCFAYVSEALRSGFALTEWDVTEYLRQLFASGGMRHNNGSIVGVNANAADPHYEPYAEQSQPIRPGDLLLLDMWGKFDEPDSVFYDITWTAYCGITVPDRIQNVFHIVRSARDAAVARVQQAVASQQPLHGFEVDDAARQVIQQAGFGEYFVHRTGHSIGVSLHGNGANMDNYETHDERRIVPRTCFSVEPGIYLPEFGIRSEVDVYVGEDEAHVTGEMQRAMVTL